MCASVEVCPVSHLLQDTNIVEALDEMKSLKETVRRQEKRIKQLEDKLTQLELEAEKEAEAMLMEDGETDGEFV